jgi:hypothetical protein
VQLTELIVLCVVVAAFLLGCVFRRRESVWGARLPLFAGIVARLAASLVVAWIAVRAAERGGVWFTALAVALGVVAIGTFALAGLLVWGLIKYGSRVEA